MAKMWEDFYFDNAVAFAFCKIFEEQKLLVGWKKAMGMAEDRKKELEKEYK